MTDLNVERESVDINIPSHLVNPTSKTVLIEDSFYYSDVYLTSALSTPTRIFPLIYPLSLGTKLKKYECILMNLPIRSPFTLPLVGHYGPIK